LAAHQHESGAGEGGEWGYPRSTNSNDHA